MWTDKNHETFEETICTTEKEENNLSQIPMQRMEGTETDRHTYTVWVHTRAHCGWHQEWHTDDSVTGDRENGAITQQETVPGNLKTGKHGLQICPVEKRGGYKFGLKYFPVNDENEMLCLKQLKRNRIWNFQSTKGKKENVINNKEKGDRERNN